MNNKMKMLIGLALSMYILMCFTILAIAFNKWWIALFSLLFLAFFKDKTEEE